VPGSPFSSSLHQGENYNGDSVDPIVGPCREKVIAGEEAIRLWDSGEALLSKLFGFHGPDVLEIVSHKSPKTANELRESGNWGNSLTPLSH